MTDVTMIQLQSSDGMAMEISLEAARASVLLATAHDADQGQKEVIAVERVGSKALESVVHFLTYHAETPMIPIPDPSKEVIAATFEEVVPQEWYRDYVTALGLDGMWRVRSAAHYMIIEPLTYLTNVWLAFYLMDKTKDQIHEILRIPKMTPEEEATAREQQPWLFQEVDDIQAAADHDEADHDDDDDEDE